MTKQRSKEDLQASREFAESMIKKIHDSSDPGAALDKSVKHNR